MSTTTETQTTELTKFQRLLIDQVGHEFAASQQYVAIAVWLDRLELPQLAGFFYRQALEERDHAMMIVRHLVDHDIPAAIPGSGPVRNDFSEVGEVVELALAQEREVTQQFYALVDAAREARDHQGEQFLHWFLREQTEEVATMSTLVTVVRRAQGSLFHVEEFVARELTAAEAESGPTPETAGPAVS
ncbi:ferritin [Spiractinospora alimapuensis]|uniref:ferritin n=1 Tax=Spiractinospora alimapuensis TaxID=2820884 RepID=UPI001F193CF0|nr:ferritin [Spiractinospora alimapuensis]QVQ53111.1 ferritin [Spiractinospora alimapuensis]